MPDVHRSWKEGAEGWRCLGRRRGVRSRNSYVWIYCGRSALQYLELPATGGLELTVHIAQRMILLPPWSWRCRQALRFLGLGHTARRPRRSRAACASAGKHESMASMRAWRSTTCTTNAAKPTRAIARHRRAREARWRTARGDDDRSPRGLFRTHRTERPKMRRPQRTAAV